MAKNADLVADYVRVDSAVVKKETVNVAKKDDFFRMNSNLGATERDVVGDFSKAKTVSSKEGAVNLLVGSIYAKAIKVDERRHIDG